ncbi:class I SAM-dependent methyltransferase [Piscibacillus salipiscarius]|uniref:Class I SAM-dependent methyltransferase n=1 Tax=Piscibacillus salipiscarius TaxID=299480 RepID=A0ABW5Q7N3_9BACI|nr:class I SAM-dependent methyltransferase [Piscibacillus salipiscarius]
MSVNYIQQLLESYNQKASERDSNQIQEWKVRERENFMKYLSDEKVTNLLEIGAGPGKDSQFFNQQGLATFSTDLSPEMVKICRNKGLEAEVMNFSNLQFANEQFDAVWALNCLLHVPKQELRDVLLEIKRVMNPGALFYMGVYGGYNHEGIWEEDFYRPKRFFSFFEANELREILSTIFEIEYFNIISKEVIGRDLEFQSVILRKVN